MSWKSFVKSSNTCVLFIFTSLHLAMPTKKANLLSSDCVHFTTMSHRRSTFLEISCEGQWPFSLLFSRCHAIKLPLFYCHCAWHTELHNVKYRMHTRYCISILHSFQNLGALVHCNAMYGKSLCSV